MASEKNELVLLERVFMRLALADTDDKLTKALETLLVPVLNVTFARARAKFDSV
jgi:hypothetical protein